MRDVVEEFSDVPWLQYSAACAAQSVDERVGAGALLEVCGSDDDTVRELAAFRAGLSGNLPVPELLKALTDGGEPIRGGAALALALSGTCELAPGDGLVRWLQARFDPSDPQYEHSWRVRANYLAARHICGDATVREDIDLYLLNANVSRLGIFVALLHTGDFLPLDMLLLEPAGLDATSFLRDARFAEVVARYLPQAPAAAMLWLEDAAIVEWQTRRLTDWWRIHRFRARFDPARRVFVVSP
jgi:hypothetical protein